MKLITGFLLRAAFIGFVLLTINSLLVGEIVMLHEFEITSKVLFLMFVGMVSIVWLGITKENNPESI